MKIKIIPLILSGIALAPSQSAFAQTRIYGSSDEATACPAVPPPIPTEYCIRSLRSTQPGGGGSIYYSGMGEFCYRGEGPDPKRDLAVRLTDFSIQGQQNRPTEVDRIEFGLNINPDGAHIDKPYMNKAIFYNNAMPTPGANATDRMMEALFERNRAYQNIRSAACGRLHATTSSTANIPSNSAFTHDGNSPSYDTKNWCLEGLDSGGGGTGAIPGFGGFGEYWSCDSAAGRQDCYRFIDPSAPAIDASPAPTPPPTSAPTAPPTAPPAGPPATIPEDPNDCYIRNGASTTEGSCVAPDGYQVAVSTIQTFARNGDFVYFRGIDGADTTYRCETGSLRLFAQTCPTRPTNNGGNNGTTTTGPTCYYDGTPYSACGTTFVITQGSYPSGQTITTTSGPHRVEVFCDSNGFFVPTNYCAF